MSKLDDLIREYCPDGVEYKKIGDICEVLTGGEAPKNSIKEKQPIGKYIYPIYSNGIGENALWGYADTYRVNRKAVTFSSIGTIGYPTIREKNFTPIIRLKVIYPKNENLLYINFLKYALEIADFQRQKSSVPNINTNMIKSIKIPVPPLPVQREIVRILDNFTELTAELTAELSDRKKQYEYYCHKLFNKVTNTEKVTLNKIAFNCDNMRKPVTSDKRQKGTIPYYGASGIVDYVKDYIFDGDYLLISEDGANLLARSKPIAFSISGKTWVNNHAHVLKFKEYATRRYVEMFLNSIDLSPYITGAAQPKLSKQKLNKIPISLPPLEEQKRMVKMLDYFESICNDLSSGLPAEIEARQKQYAYYRDKLLDFKPLEKRAE